MTTLNNDELREQTWKVAAGILGIDDNDGNSDAIHSVAIAIQFHIDKLIATHDQQLLEAILEGATYTGDPNGVHRDARGQVSAINLVQAVPVEHIKSVFNKEGE